MKLFKNKFILGVVFIVVIILIIASFSKIKEHIALKDVFVFSKDNIVSIWRVEKGRDVHDYHYKLESDEINYLSNILKNSELKKATTNDSPSNTLGSITLLLDGKIKEEDGGMSFKYERGITLATIDENSVYIFLELNELRNHDDIITMEGIMQKSYVINSNELAEFVNEHT